MAETIISVQNTDLLSKSSEIFGLGLSLLDGHID
jgi:hypothetical protein